MRFRVDKEKTVEALLYIVNRYGEAGRFHALKTLYFADLRHLCTFGRPITGDRYIAMENGPVPSYAYNALKAEVHRSEIPMIESAIADGHDPRHPSYCARREPDLSFFSKTDLECLDWAFEHCSGRTFGSISDETHQHAGWDRAPLNKEMKLEDMLDGVDDAIREDAMTFASYGVV